MRRFNRDDLKASNPLVSSGNTPFLKCVWSVYDHYEAPNRYSRDEERYLRAPEGARVKFRHQPLVDTPHLFLEFARLVEAKKGPEVLYEWTYRRGLLGLHENSDKGGPGELVYESWVHACRARNLLAMYEAALSRDMEKLRQVFDPKTGSWSAGPGLIPFLSHELKIEGSEQAFTAGNEQQGPWEHREQMRLMTDMSDVHFIKLDVSLDEVQSVDYLAEAAIRIVIALVQDTLGSLVRPSFGTLAPHTLDTSRSWWEPDLLTRSWVPVNLLGAMYLQFYWMMTSSGDLARCKYCGQIISRAPSTVGSSQTRKPRNDKEFCGNGCRQNYHYHNRIKPARQGTNKGSGRPQA